MQTVHEADHSDAGQQPAHDTAVMTRGEVRLCDIDTLAADIEAQALAAQTLCEISFEEIDSYADSDPDVGRIMLRLDALLKAVYRNVVLVQEAAVTIGELVVEGGAA